MPETVVTAANPSEGANPNGEVKPSTLDGVLDGETVPEKLRGKKVADLLGSYVNLEKKLGELTAPKPKTEEENGKPTPVVAAEPEPADEAAILQSVGLTAEEIGEAWKKDGKLTEDQYSKFKAKGYSKAAVDAHMRLAARAARADELEDAQAAAAAIAEFGGQEQVKTLREWAAGNIPEPRLKALGEQYTSGAISYVDYLKLLGADHAKAVGAGRAKPLIAATSTAAGSQEAFTTSHEMHRAIAEAEKKFGPGLWNKDPTLMARIAKTPRHITAGV